MPAYAGLLGSMGLTFLLRTQYLLPITVLALAVAVAGLAFRARRRHGYWPLVIGVVAALLIVGGKFVVETQLTVYSGAALLLVASVWNSWPKARKNPLLVSLNEGGFAMADKRKVEVFSAGCPACDETVKLVESIACPSCDVEALDMNDPNVASRAKSLGVQSVPAVVIDGKLADCCTGRGPDETTLKAAGIGQPAA